MVWSAVQEVLIIVRNCTSRTDTEPELARNCIARNCNPEQEIGKKKNKLKVRSRRRVQMQFLSIVFTLSFQTGLPPTL
jgi:hypothetical protein